MELKTIEMAMTYLGLRSILCPEGASAQSPGLQLWATLGVVVIEDLNR
jgi:hypothetical protein